MSPLTYAWLPVEPISSELEDRDLARQLARGEEGALERIVERYGRCVAGLARRLLAWQDGADDVAQDVFLAVLRNAGKYRREANLWTFLATITVNRCRTLRRRQWLKERMLAMVWPTAARAESNPGGPQAETAEVVRLAVARLPAGYREVIVLKYLEGLNTTEVANVLGLKRNTVDVRLARAKKMLEAALEHLVHDHA